MPACWRSRGRAEPGGGRGRGHRETLRCTRCDSANRFPLVTVVDDSAFASQSLGNWLWVTFTRSDPANDVHGIDSFVSKKHWGCRGPVVIDARLKPHMAPPLEEDPAVARRVDALFAKGGPLHGIGG